MGNGGGGGNMISFFYPIKDKISENVRGGGRSKKHFHKKFYKRFKGIVYQSFFYRFGKRVLPKKKTSNKIKRCHMRLLACLPLSTYLPGNDNTTYQNICHFHRRTTFHRTGHFAKMVSKKRAGKHEKMTVPSAVRG